SLTGMRHRRREREKPAPHPALEDVHRRFAETTGEAMISCLSLRWPDVKNFYAIFTKLAAH
ncbi:MAG TPA: hypothetical protein VFW68_00255, partial [Rhodocyclaceae bacterium]|nr:hypothetical protein [Rhodocyclaceae bacterium]